MIRNLTLSAVALLLFSCDKRESSVKVGSDRDSLKPISSEAENANSMFDSVSGKSNSEVKSDPKVEKWTTRRFAKPSVSIVIDPKKDTIITLPEGTKLNIAGDSFVFATSQNAVSGKITLKVREFYRLEDILKAGLSTTSGNRMLETGGMLFIEAESEGKKLKLGEGKEMEIAFASAVKSDMELFLGKEEKEGIDWEKPAMSEYVVPNVSRVTSFSMQDIRLKFKFDLSEEKQGLYRIRMKPDGTILEAKTIQSITPTIDGHIEQQLIGQKVLLSGYLPNHEITNVMPVTLNPADRIGQKAMKYSMAKTEIEKGKARKQAIAQKEISKVTRFFRTPQLGWINCDRFLNLPGDKSDLAFDIGNNELTTIFLVFRNSKSVLARTTSASAVTFANLPRGEPVTAIAIKSDKDGLYISRENIEVSSDKMAFNFRKSDAVSAQNEIAGWANQQW
ncbi:hypothetical protein [Flavobacterium sp.]|uniref:hypothetical protein n=1 Tax=Flavobacterium sp. TaxID=239 RepID=UPI0012113161|nr:hypothetical protein [Flavobacterium sp.]RZJ69464.1 MAG: hypothetical protein EOO49_17290 [Flavobacterium sp.]